MAVDVGAPKRVQQNMDAVAVFREAGGVDQHDGGDDFGFFVVDGYAFANNFSVSFLVKIFGHFL